MKWNDILKLVESIERLGSYTVLEHNESVKDIIILNSKLSELKSIVGDLWDIKVEKTDYIDRNNSSDYLINVRINNKVGDIISTIEVVGLGYLYENNNLIYLKEHIDEFNRFIEVNRGLKSNTLKDLEQLVNN